MPAPAADEVFRGGTGLRRRLWWLTIALGIAAIGGYFLLPGGGFAQAVAYNAMGLLSGLAMLAGVWLHRPSRRALWIFFAAGQLMNVAGDVIWNIYEYGLHQEPFPSVADIFYLGSYPLLGAGLVRLVRQHHGRRPRHLLDAAIVATGTGLVFWVFVLHPAAAAAANTPLERMINTAYPAVDVMLLAILAGLFTLPGARTASTWLLAGAALALLVADVGYSVLTAHLSFDDGNPLDAAWLLSYVLWGAAALHPSMSARPAAIAHGVGTGLGRGRQALLAVCSLLAPGLLFVPGVAARPADWMVAAAGTVALFLLVSARMSGFVNRVQKQAGQLEKLALHDELTGLANRRRFQAQLSAALGNGPCCIALLDLTGFKKINDQFGHRVGDLLLAEVAGRLTAAADHPASVARMGGDEFTLLLPAASRESATEVAEHVRRLLAQPIRVAGHELLISANIGLTETDSLGDPVEALRRADVAMYAAKELGEPYRWYDLGLDRRAGEDARVGAELRTALDAGQLRLVYQPIVELPTGRQIAVEALVRWHHPDRGVISPAEFIPVAERNGTIVEMGAWILRTACLRMARWHAEHGPAAPRHVSVNVSARQLARPGLAEVVASALADSGLPASCLTVEVTETAVFETDRAIQTLHQLDAMGVRIALDDFGTGHSSLALLRTVPAHALKVDKSFVDEVTVGGRTSVIAAALIQVADALGMTAVAEGVETAEQAAELHRLGYRLAQGYHFGRPAEQPLPAELPLIAEAA
ncbi:signal peptide protein [Actinoplanes sp. SE50]|uniref:putative bifunctional diguanylate cyclase/phosphodiesterase n=1 Tax=unclassified Actinoplanes TaxID=2626549 RepID=UPI00023ED5E8|nr:MULTISPECIES: bifunctional diguanylate cyclase/phosphodiesterase [unclassified Actinoplanes]AEV84457.1 putative signaling protein [Actinoplanes sp. SE50/110]ATO82849.1 signal peptide protein [Actinoplanes sp. SE50]SLM00257.1 diguanylate cyclase [Actinoplanes sp. SE50/110]